MTYQEIIGAFGMLRIERETGLRELKEGEILRRQAFDDCFARKVVRLQADCAQLGHLFTGQNMFGNAEDSICAVCGGEKGAEPAHDFHFIK